MSPIGRPTLRASPSDARCRCGCSYRCCAVTGACGLSSQRSLTPGRPTSRS